MTNDETLLLPSILLVLTYLMHLINKKNQMNNLIIGITCTIEIMCFIAAIIFDIYLLKSL